MHFDEPGVGRECLDPIKARDVVNLVENRERHDLADAGDRPQAVKGVAIMPLGLADDRQLEVGDETVVPFEEREVDVNALADAGIGKVLAHAGSIGGIREAPTELGELILGSRVLDVPQELAPLPHDVQPTAQEIARRAHRRRVDVRLRQQAAPEQGRTLLRITLVVLRFAAVNGLHRYRGSPGGQVGTRCQRNSGRITALKAASLSGSRGTA